MVFGFLALTWAAAPAASASKKKAPVKRPAATSKAKSPSKSGARSSTRRASSAGRTPARKPVAAWRNRQLQPTTDRYKQIQEALAAKGYLPAEEATGAWGANSVDALKRFQADQKIDGSGKINSLSLIALGLGPKRENVAAAKPAAPSAGQ